MSKAGRWWTTAFTVLGSVAGVVRPASGQAASLSATARVLQQITVLGNRNLGFANVFPGVNKTIPVTSGTSGRYRVDGANNASVLMTFTLPANLVRAGGALLPINGWTGHHNTANNATGGTNFVPSALPTPMILSGTGRRWVFIGATVTPAANQQSGAYTATATLTVVYM